jgi:hypothetical protein
MSDYAYNYIKAAMRLIGAISSGEAPTTDEYADALASLQYMLRSWSSQDLNIHCTTQESFAVSGAEYYTIGSGGTFNTTRPTSIRGAYLDSKDNQYKILTESEYRSQSSGLWYSPEYPLGKIYLYPADTGTLYLDTLKPITELTATGDYLYVPPEYDEAIRYNLAVRLAPEFGKPISQELMFFATESMKCVVTRNFPEKVNTVKPEVLSLASGRYNIDSDI